MPRPHFPQVDTLKVWTTGALALHPVLDDADYSLHPIERLSVLAPEAVGPVCDEVSQPGMLNIIISHNSVLIAGYRERYILHTESSIF